MTWVTAVRNEVSILFFVDVKQVEKVNLLLVNQVL